MTATGILMDCRWWLCRKLRANGRFPSPQVWATAVPPHRIYSMKTITNLIRRLRQALYLFGIMLIIGLAACGGGDAQVVEEATAVATPTATAEPTATDESVPDEPTATAVANPTPPEPLPDVLSCAPPIIVGQPLQIAFQSDLDNEDGNLRDIYTINSDGTAFTRLIRTPGREYGPHWVPDGSQIAFFGEEGLYTMNADGSQLQNMAIPANDPVSWSPDGQEIAYFAPPPSESGGFGFLAKAPQLFVSRRDGTDIRQLTDMELAVTNPVWSPNGSQILFEYGPYEAVNYGDERDDLPINLYIINKDGSELRQLAPGEHDQIQAAWSLDGRQIAFLERPVQRIVLRDGESRNYEDIFVVNADGSDLRQITTDNGRVGLPTWSPDGNQLVYLQYEPGGWGMDDTALQIINKDGTCPRRLLDFNDLNIWTIAWSPYDSRLALGARELSAAGRADGRFGIYTLYADGTQLTRITPNDEADYGRPAWQRTGEDPLVALETAVTQSSQTDNAANLGAASSSNTAIPFTVGDLERTAPEGIFRQVNYFGMFDVLLGDLGCNNFSFGPNEGEGRFEEAYQPLDVFSKAAGYAPKAFPDLYDRLTLLSCDWQPGNAVSVQVTTPDGEVIEKSFVYGEEITTSNAESTGVDELVVLPDDPYDEGDLRLAYTPGVDNTPGSYTLKVEGNGRAIQHTFDLVQPTDPRVFATVNQQGDEFWHLVQFGPQEEIQIVGYGQSGCVGGDPSYYQIDINMSPLCLRGWKAFTVDENGRLLFQVTPTDEFVYFAIAGERSSTFPLSSFIKAEVVEAYYQVRHDWLPWFTESLAIDAPRFRLQPGNVVRVIGQSGSLDRVRLSDGTEGWVVSAALDKADTAVPDDDIPVLFNGDIAALPEWVYLPAGTYSMGSSNYDAQYTEPAEQPPHSITLNPFWMQRTEVSNANYAACVADSACTPPTASASATQANYYGNDAFADYPVLFVTHDQAQAYCQWVDGRLPTEAEWEYAARFPTSGTSYYIWGVNPDQADASLANFGKNSGDTIPVTALLDGANEAGLLNMHGNVWEWTADWFDENYYATSPEGNPTGPTSGSEKVARGGSWSTNLEYISLTNRFTRSPNQGYDNVGFRCVRVTSP